MRFIIAITVALFLVLSLVKCDTSSDILDNSNQSVNDLSDKRATHQIESPLENDSEFLRWFPWKKTVSVQLRNTDENGDECVVREEEHSSIDEFPNDLFTQEQRLQGAIVLHFIGAIYFFTVSGMVINYYFIPSVQCICNDLKITPDVGAAVFMASATATPEMFTNVISTFIAESDMGLGTIIGSLMWNILGVAAVSSLANRNPVRMDWFPITRDCVVFAINVAVLVVISWDERIFWWEALILLIMAVLYYVTMFQSHRISKFMKRKFEDDYGCCIPGSTNFDVKDEIRKPSIYSIRDTIENIPRASVYSIYSTHDNDTLQAKARQSITVHNHDFEILEAMKRRSTITRNVLDVEAKKDVYRKSASLPEIAQNTDVLDAAAEKAELERKTYLAIKSKRLGLWGHPPEDSWARTIFWYYSYPIRLALRCTMPNPKINRRWYPYTFIMCVVWIGAITYLLFWMLIIIGHTFSIPESVMGLTVFAIGGCTPEMITGIIMARRGHTGTGIANSMGASSLGIVLCLGVPWAISCILLNNEGKEPVLEMHGYGIKFTIMMLAAVSLTQFSILATSRFRLLKLTGIALAIAYLSFITYAVCAELGFIYPAPPDC